MNICRWRKIHEYEYKLDGVGPIDNRPSTNKLNHFVIKKNNVIVVMVVTQVTVVTVVTALTVVTWIGENIFWLQYNFSKLKLDAGAHITKFQLITDFCRFNITFIRLLF